MFTISPCKNHINHPPLGQLTLWRPGLCWGSINPPHWGRHKYNPVISQLQSFQTWGPRSGSPDEAWTKIQVELFLEKFDSSSSDFLCLPTWNGALLRTHFFRQNLQRPVLWASIWKERAGSRAPRAHCIQPSGTSGQRLADDQKPER